MMIRSRLCACSQKVFHLSDYTIMQLCSPNSYPFVFLQEVDQEGFEIF